MSEASETVIPQEQVDVKTQLQEQIDAWDSLGEDEKENFKNQHDKLETDEAIENASSEAIAEHLRQHKLNKENPAYVVRGAELMCDHGTNKRQLNLSPCHGVYIRGHAVPHELDCIQGEEDNITMFGVCNSGEAPDVELIKLVDDNGVECHGKKCCPKIVGVWQDSFEGTRIVDTEKREEDLEQLEGCSTITMDSFLVCKYGGIIIPVNSGQDREVGKGEFCNPDEAPEVLGFVNKCAGESDIEGGCEDLLHEYHEKGEENRADIHGSNYIKKEKGIEEKLKENCKYNWMKEGLLSTPFATEEFIEKTIEISQDLGIEPDDLFAVMAFESWFNPQEKSKYSSAVGLIQFLRVTAEALGTTTEELQTMSNVDQLDYVYKYYKSYTGKLNDVYDVYMVTLCPKAVGKPNDYVIYSQGTLEYDHNKGLDFNADGQITKEEATQAVIERREEFVW